MLVAHITTHVLLERSEAHSKSRPKAERGIPLQTTGKLTRVIMAGHKDSVGSLNKSVSIRGCCTAQTEGRLSY